MIEKDEKIHSYTHIMFDDFTGLGSKAPKNSVFNRYG
jgi:hypothetical protein